jgi:hypothetical protein
MGCHHAHPERDADAKPVDPVEAALAQSLGDCNAHWDEQGELTAEQKRRKFEEETFRRGLAVNAKTAERDLGLSAEAAVLAAKPVEWAIELIRSGESERLRVEGRRNYLMNRAKLARWRREGYTFDAEHRMVAPSTARISHRGERERRPATARRSSTRTRSGSSGDPPQDADPPLACGRLGVA